MDKIKASEEEFVFTLFRKEDLRSLWKPQIEILFILKGTGQIYFANTKTTYTIREEDIFVINSFEMSNLELEGSSVVLSCSISLSFASALVPEILKYQVNCRSFLYGEDEQETFHILRRDLASAFKEQYKNTKQTVIYLRSRAVAIVEDLGRYFLDRNNSFVNRGSLETLIPAIYYIQAHFRENITLDHLVEQTFLSKTYVSRSFTKYLGVSFTEYITLLRIAYAVKMLQGNETISKIALESGFPNVNAMILAFKRYRGITPGEYRKNQEYKEKYEREVFNEDEARDLFSSLMKYSEKNTDIQQPIVDVREIIVDVNVRRSRITPHWKRILNGGYARSIIDGTIQKEIHYLKEKIGFEYIRIKGILDDDMCLLRTDMNGKIIVNYEYVNEVIDFITSIGAKPMIELGCVPSLLAGNTMLSSMRRGIFGVPSDIGKWYKLIKELMEHLVSRYDSRNVRQWLFSMWPSPDFVDLGMCSQEEYEEIYMASYSAIKTTNPNFLITGPGTTEPERYLVQFFQMCKRRNCFPDVLTFRSFATGGEREENRLNLIGNNESFPMAVSGDENLLKSTVYKIKKILKDWKILSIPLVLEEWSNNIWQRDLCNDTCYKSAWLFKNILENNQELNGMGYFTLNDRLDEVPPASDTFHGGFGLFTKNDIPKSACRAMELLGEMGNRLLQKGEGYFITCSEKEIQIFLYNYSHYDLLYRYRHVVNMSKTKRYNVFVSEKSQAFYIRLEKMEDGKYQVRRYYITQEGGSSYDSWVKMGAPDPMDEEEIEILKNLSKPLYKRDSIEVKQGILRIKAKLNPQDVCLIKIKKL